MEASNFTKWPKRVQQTTNSLLLYPKSGLLEHWPIDSLQSILQAASQTKFRHDKLGVMSDGPAPVSMFSVIITTLDRCEAQINLGLHEMWASRGCKGCFSRESSDAIVFFYRNYLLEIKLQDHHVFRTLFNGFFELHESHQPNISK